MPSGAETAIYADLTLIYADAALMYADACRAAPRAAGAVSADLSRPGPVVGRRTGFCACLTPSPSGSVSAVQIPVMSHLSLLARTSLGR